MSREKSMGMVPGEVPQPKAGLYGARRSSVHSSLLVGRRVGGGVLAVEGLVFFSFFSWGGVVPNS